MCHVISKNISEYTVFMTSLFHHFFACAVHQLFPVATVCLPDFRVLKKKQRNVGEKSKGKRSKTRVASKINKAEKKEGKKTSQTLSSVVVFLPFDKTKFVKK